MVKQQPSIWWGFMSCWALFMQIHSILHSSPMRWVFLLAPLYRCPHSRSWPKVTGLEVEESGLTPKSTHWALAATLSMPQTTCRQDHQAWLALLGRKTPMTQRLENAQAPEPAAGNAGSLCCPEETGGGQGGLTASHLPQLKPRIMPLRFPLVA